MIETRHRQNNIAASVFGKIACVVLAALLVVFLVPHPAWATGEKGDTQPTTTPTSGVCGDGVKYELNAAGELRIYSTGDGTGTLDAGNVFDDKLDKDKVNSIVVEEGVKANPDSSTLFIAFERCASVDLRGLDTSSVTDMNCMFKGSRTIKNLDLSTFDTSNATNMAGMFDECVELENVNLSSFDTSNVTDMNCMFRGCCSLINLDLSNFNPSKVTDMYFMFDECISLNSLNLTHFDTTNATRMTSMFGSCVSLKSLDLTSFKTSNVFDMSFMFYKCQSLKSLNISSFSTSRVRDFTDMFCDCSSLTDLNPSSFDTSSAEQMVGMFENCSSLTSLNLSNFNTPNVYGIGSMFRNCSSLTDLDISSIDTKTRVNSFGVSNCDVSGLFDGCSALKSIKVSAKSDLTEAPFPIPNPSTIPGATGKWINSKGDVLDPSEIPACVADTYKAETKTSDPTTPPSGGDNNPGGTTDPDNKPINPPSSGGSSSSDEPSTPSEPTVTDTKTETSEDGNVTTKTETKSDGSSTITTTNKETGTTTVKETAADKTSVETTTTKDGVEAVVKSDANDKVVSTEVNVPKDANENEAVVLPVENVKPDSDTAVSINATTGSSVVVPTPADDTKSNTILVAITIDKNGKEVETILPKCVPCKDGVAVVMPNATVTIKVKNAEKASYPDVSSNDWFESQGVVDFVTSRGLITGAVTPTGTQFLGNESMNRAMFATVLNRLESNEAATVDSAFEDVSKDGAWYSDTVAWAAEKGLVKGYGDTGKFGPNDTVTREQMAVIMMRYAEMLGLDTSARTDISGFSDADTLTFGRDAMSWAVAEGLLKGYEGQNALGSTNGTTRAECAVVLMRLIEFQIG